MKTILSAILLMISISGFAQTVVIDGDLYILNAHSETKKNNRDTSKNLKVEIGNEKDVGEIAVMSDLIVHQDLKLYVINPLNGKISRLDLDEESEFYGSVDVVGKLLVKQGNKYFSVNPANGKTKRLRNQKAIDKAKEL